MKYLKIILTLVILSIAFSFICYAPPVTADNDNEIIKLRQKVAELEKRIKEMEAVLVKYQEQEKYQEEAAYPWQNRMNWRKLQTGMSAEQVRNLLGEPIKAIEGVKTLWYYPDIYRGYVSFDDKGLLTGWHEP
jgi:hypothetical protein